MITNKDIATKMLDIIIIKADLINKCREKTIYRHELISKIRKLESLSIELYRQGVNLEDYNQLYQNLYLDFSNVTLCYTYIGLKKWNNKKESFTRSHIDRFYKDLKIINEGQND